ncbi:4-hydroxythreonine-4-phosphate dehydrogenase [Prochlorococcus marinus]|uniref:4-hydroxythreonine-4-phosphate dehydrogenase n=1 Tax=Prochlorococcus marinus TaxID=1219 RepID=UPI0022B2D259|nr:4-hydroxythreonine-4-phosphate dehydrogenase [Prochlorococcus marinus]
MLRFLFLGLVIYGIAIGLRDGWLIVKWSQLFYNVGFSQVDPEKPMNWSEFIIDRLTENESKQDKD